MGLRFIVAARASEVISSASVGYIDVDEVLSVFAAHAPLPCHRIGARACYYTMGCQFDLLEQNQNLMSLTLTQENVATNIPEARNNRFRRRERIVSAMLDHLKGGVHEARFWKPI